MNLLQIYVVEYSSNTLGFSEAQTFVSESTEITFCGLLLHVIGKALSIVTGFTYYTESRYWIGIY